MGKYDQIKIKIEDVDKAFKETPSSIFIADNEIYFYELVEFRHVFNFPYFVCLLEDYVNSEDSTRYEYDTEDKNCFGLQCYKFLGKYLKK